MRSERERGSAGHEIELIELLQALWGGKLLIAATAALVAFVAAAYVFMATPLYEAKVVIESPGQNDIAQLNYGRGGESGLDPLTVKDVYSIYTRNLLSESLRRKFFRTVYLPTLGEGLSKESEDRLYKQFGKMLVVTQVSKDLPARYSLKAELPDSRQAAQWVVQYADMAAAQAKHEVLRDVKSDATLKASNLEQQITMAREAARKKREDREVRLREALAVAKSIGLQRPPIISGNLASEISAEVGGALSYMRGSLALEAEIENLQKRNSDDPFIKGLRQDEADFAFYRGLNIEPAVVTVYRQDGVVEMSDGPVWPNKPLIIMMGALLGGVVGILVVLVQGLVRRILGRRV